MRLRQTLLLGTLLLVSSPPFAFAQAQQPPQEQPRQPQQQPVARLNVAELESLAAPIAFYKDQVIENILAAAQDPVAIQKYVATEKSATNAAQPSESLVFLSAHPNLLKQLGAGEFPHKADMLALASRLPLLDVNDAVIEAVAAYIANHVMPNDPGGDAFHLAVASFHRCDFLVTWNCHHIANANKFGHIRRVNGILGLGNPTLVTPLQLLNEETNDG